MKRVPRPHGHMPFPQGQMGPFPGQPPMMMGPGPGMPSMPGTPGMGQPIQPPFGQPYSQEIPQISIEHVQMEVQPLVQEGSHYINRIALISYLLGLGYPLEEARRLVDSYLR